MNNIRTTALNILITITLIALMAIFCLRLAADINFNLAEKTSSSQNKDMAFKLYAKAMMLNPFNADYPAAYGKFILNLSLKDKDIALIQKAEGLYKQAIALNPRATAYYLELGLIKLLKRDALIEKRLLKKEDDTLLMDEILQEFGKAVQNDPNGFYVSYNIGCAGLKLWDRLNSVQREFILGNLKSALNTKPWLADEAYKKLWNKTKDFALLQYITPENYNNYLYLYGFIRGQNLWQYYKDVKAKLDSCKDEKHRIAEFQNASRLRNLAVKGKLKNWSGVSDAGEEYKDGAMYWTGTMDAAINVPEGETVLIVQAMGTPANNAYPYMILELDGEEIGKTIVDNQGAWKDYNFNINTDGGVKVLSITFANDDGNAEKREDRNLYIGNVTINKK